MCICVYIWRIHVYMVCVCGVMHACTCVWCMHVYGVCACVCVVAWVAYVYVCICMVYACVCVYGVCMCVWCMRVCARVFVYGCMGGICVYMYTQTVDSLALPLYHSVAHLNQIDQAAVNEAGKIGTVDDAHTNTRTNTRTNTHMHHIVCTPPCRQTSCAHLHQHHTHIHTYTHTHTHMYTHASIHPHMHPPMCIQTDILSSLGQNTRATHHHAHTPSSPSPPLTHSLTNFLSFSLFLSLSLSHTHIYTHTYTRAHTHTPHLASRMGRPQNLGLTSDPRIWASEVGVGRQRHLPPQKRNGKGSAKPRWWSGCSSVILCVDGGETNLYLICNAATFLGIRIHTNPHARAHTQV